MADLNVGTTPELRPESFKKILSVSSKDSNSVPSKTYPDSACRLHAGFLLRLLFDPEDGSDMFLCSIGLLSPYYTAMPQNSHRRDDLKSSVQSQFYGVLKIVHYSYHCCISDVVRPVVSEQNTAFRKLNLLSSMYFHLRTETDRLPETCVPFGNPAVTLLGLQPSLQNPHANTGFSEPSTIPDKHTDKR
jgi:hypothetical protein